MQKDPDRDLIGINQLLGQQPTILFIPANQLIPWSVLVIISYVLTLGFFDFGLGAFATVSLWFCIGWWILTGKHPHQFVDRFRFPPGKDWYSANLPYISPLIKNRSAYLRKQVPDNTLTARLKPLIKTNQKGQQYRFMPFQNFQDLVCLISIEKDGYQVAGLLLNRGSTFQIVFPFKTPGYHNNLERTEVSNYAVALEEGLKEVLPGERLIIHTQKFGNGVPREQELSAIADECDLLPVAVLTRNEQKRVRELHDEGIRQCWNSTLFCTWTYDENAGATSNDLTSQSIKWVTAKFKQALTWFSGNARVYQERFYQQLFLQAFNQGFVNWETILNNKLGLAAQPLSSDELWHWLWYKFHSPTTTVPAKPQLFSLKETEQGFVLDESVANDRHIVTVLTEGIEEPACPEHRSSQDTVWLPGRQQKCAVLTLTERPKTAMSQREQLRWFFEVLSQDYVRDTEAVVEISLANDRLIEDSLAKIAKQSRSAQKHAVLKGQGRDVGAEIKAEESFEAQKQLRKGARSFHTAVTFFVYRSNPKELDLACLKLSRSFGTAKVKRERNIAWSLWLDSLPININRLLQNNSALEDRRHVFSNHTVWRFFPLTVTRDLDRQGVELISSGGKPIYVDLCHQQTSRALILGTSGSGKTVLAWQFMLDHLRAGIPVIGMDISSGQGNSFKTAIELLGDEGAYHDLRYHSNNLMELPDLRRFNGEQREERMNQWLDSVRAAIVEIAMGKVNDPRLAQRVEAIAAKTLNIFLSDPEIVERYNLALEKGWKSQAWQDMPVLKDWLKFCTKEQLNFSSFEAIDQTAINQIQVQVSALLESPLGKAIGRPSSFSPNPKIKFFALSGLDSEAEQNIIALTTQAACLRNALAYPRSLIVGDEVSVLFKKQGFANGFGNWCAVGRKSGISIILISQDLDAIQNCSARDQILQNINYRLIGRITSSGAKSLTHHLGYNPSLINQNSTELFLPDKTRLCSKWLIEKDNRFWQAEYYPAAMTLAAVANSPSELEARDRVMANYPDNLRGQMLGLRDFSEQYVSAIRSGSEISNIGAAENSIVSAPKKPASLHR